MPILTFNKNKIELDFNQLERRGYCPFLIQDQIKLETPYNRPDLLLMDMINPFEKVDEALFNIVYQDYSSENVFEISAMTEEIIIFLKKLNDWVNFQKNYFIHSFEENKIFFKVNSELKNLLNLFVLFLNLRKIEFKTNYKLYVNSFKIDFSIVESLLKNNESCLPQGNRKRFVENLQKEGFKIDKSGLVSVPLHRLDIRDTFDLVAVDAVYTLASRKRFDQDLCRKIRSNFLKLETFIRSNLSFDFLEIIPQSLDQESLLNKIKSVFERDDEVVSLKNPLSSLKNCYHDSLFLELFTNLNLNKKIFLISPKIKSLKVALITPEEPFQFLTRLKSYLFEKSLFEIQITKKVLEKDSLKQFKIFKELTYYQITFFD